VEFNNVHLGVIGVGTNAKGRVTQIAQGHRRTANQLLASVNQDQTAFR
jgi:hypothetical protein